MKVKALFTPSVLQETSLALMIVAAIWFLASSIRWPLVGDASLMHYIVFLMDKGRVPYRDIGDMNYPAAYLPDYVVIHTVGPSALAWRTYDFLLLLVVGLEIIRIAGMKSWKTGLWGALLFAIIHGRDGLYQVGQRDLTMAALLLVAVAALLKNSDGSRPQDYLIFGLGVGAAGMIKPIGLLFIVLASPILWRLRKQRRTIYNLAIMMAGFAIPALLTLVWLVHMGALLAFFQTQNLLTAYHAALARRPLDFLMMHSFSPIFPIVLAWILLRLISFACSTKSSDDEEEWRAAKLTALGFAIALGFLSYVIQGKGFPYHRYIFLAFLITYISIDLDRALVHKDKFLRWASSLTLMTTSILIGIVSAVVIAKYNWQSQEFETSLEADLRSVASSGGVESLDNRVQCLDSISGCLTTLYNLNIPQSTGLIYDEFLFRPAGTATVDETRRIFWQSVNAMPPSVFVVTARLFPSGPDDFEKLNQWPDFAEWLKNNYRLAIERESMRSVRQGGPTFSPSGYRIYIRRRIYKQP